MAAFAIGRNTQPDDAMYWNVTGQHPHPEVDNTEPNCMSKIVQWMRDETVPLLHKVGMAALGVLAILALGFVIGQKILVCTLATVITLVWAKRESNEIDRKETKMVEEAQAAARTLQEQNGSLARMKELFGGEAAYNALPNLDLGGRMGDSGYIDFLQPADLAAPIMKGVDKFGRPFITLKVQLRDDAATQATFIAFQRFTGGGRWDYKGSNLQFEDAFAQVSSDEIRQLMGNRHPNFQLDRIG